MTMLMEARSMMSRAPSSIDVDQSDRYSSSFGPEDTHDNSPSLLSPMVTPRKVRQLNLQRVQVDWSKLDQSMTEFLFRKILTCNYFGSPANIFEMKEEECRAIAHISPNLCCLFSQVAAPMSILDYCRRILAYTRCSPECFVTALCYIERLASCGLPITPRSIHRVLMTCVVLAVKYLDDVFFPTSYYAQVGGLSARDLNLMEIECFLLLGFDCGVTAEDYDYMAMTLSR